MRYQISGTHPQTRMPVTVDIGWTEGASYWAGIVGDDRYDTALHETLPELIAATRFFVHWDRRLRYAMAQAHPDPALQEDFMRVYARDHRDPVADLILSTAA